MNGGGGGGGMTNNLVGIGVGRVLNGGGWTGQERVGGFGYKGCCSGGGRVV